MNLKLGDKSSIVVKLQETLKQKGFYKLKIDGEFGSGTEKALKEYQTSLGVFPSGVVGPWVAEKLGLTNKIIKPKKTIALTAGHSNQDPGAVSGIHKEAVISADFRNEIAKRLRSKGYNVFTDGEGHVNLRLSEAIKVAEKADVAIEFHLNAFSNPAAGGVEVLAHAKDKLLSQNICEAISRILEIPVRGSEKGWKPENSGQHSRLGFIRAGGIIVESFFITNPEELQKYLKRKSELYDAITEAIIKSL